jgi:hypothetical protein
MASPEELARVLRERAADRRAADRKRGDRAWAALVTALRATGGFRRAWVVGSLGTERFGGGSDADVVVEGLPREAWGPTWAALQAAVDVPLDLLRLEELDDAFAETVSREGRLVVER